MDHNTSKERDLVVDLESGEDTNIDLVLGNRREKNLLSGLASGFLGFSGSAKGKCSAKLYNNLGKSSDVSHENLELLIDKNSGGQCGEHVPFVEKQHMKENHKTTKSKKAPKPPRPPKAPSLDATDLKFVKEISELAKKKHARIERIKALKKMKAAKSSSSSNSTLSAMVVTLLFCLVVIFQGICSRYSSHVTFQGSPEPAAATDGLISVQFYNNPLASNSIEPSSESPNLVEQFSGSEFRSPG